MNALNMFSQFLGRPNRNRGGLFNLDFVPMGFLGYDVLVLEVLVDGHILYLLTTRDHSIFLYHYTSAFLFFLSVECRFKHIVLNKLTKRHLGLGLLSPLAHNPQWGLGAPSLLAISQLSTASPLHTPHL
ncbi:hypothetical protein JAAARDRAFT_573237 [Jaapia argillacea MUCL 33604]|uniref:Uncharacterized protein n=1 Tax=Jaapia argillacea MUCL 33604 TaxID=933084 RepID=A0A067Q235_9AGAM|nr:hypothetical protein JAAARDRAFT_573237 [Jaapia argillacea MUCL 33604]